MHVTLERKGPKLKTTILTLLVTVLGIAFIAEDAGAAGAKAIVAYDFEKIQGNVVKDVSGNGNDGELKGGPQRIEGKIGQALAFDGRDDFIDLGDDMFLFDEMTVMFWANKIGVQVNNWPTYFTIREPDGSAAGIYWDKVSKEVRIFALKPGVIEEQNLSNNRAQAIVDGEWHHIVGVFSAKSGRAIYIDGKLAARDKSFRGNPADLKGTNTYVARGRTHNPGEYVFGNIDEFVLAEGVVTQEAIQLHRDEGIKGGLAIQAVGKLATTWANIKESL